MRVAILFVLLVLLTLSAIHGEEGVISADEQVQPIGQLLKGGENGGEGGKEAAEQQPKMLMDSPIEEKEADGKQGKEAANANDDPQMGEARGNRAKRQWGYGGYGYGGGWGRPWGGGWGGGWGRPWGGGWGGGWGRPWGGWGGGYGYGGGYGGYWG